jgi:hypothetical protein
MMTALFAVTLSVAGISNASWFGSDDKAETKSESTAPAASVKSDAASPAASDEVLPADKQLTLSGTIDENSQFVDKKGEIFNLANNDKGMEVKSLTGKQIEIKGTVMERAGLKIVDVKEYKILEK